ncbi:MAG: SulP family inorganic anion transporter [Phycisphaeraceae bacterium]|nr:SulP family inorganic anion transporter [Phycisphaeraceae bacterium]
MFILNSLAVQAYESIAETFRGYRWSTARDDLIAGLTVSVVDLPQSMAFAVIAGVSPVYGLYTAIIQAFLGGLLTSSKFLSNGPTNTQSLLVASIVARVAHGNAEDYLRLVIALTLLKGVIQLLFATANMGSLVRYVSRSVMVGFTAGAGVLIILEQLPSALGLNMRSHGVHWPGVIGAIERLWPHLREIDPQHPHAPAICAGSIVLVVAAKRIWRFIPGPLLAVVGSAALVWAMGWTDQTLHIIGELPRGLPRFQLPSLSILEAEHLLTGALALALLGMLESVSIAKAIAMRTGQQIDANQEFFGQGVSNLVASFFQCMPGSGSFSRSALQYAVGARTRVANLLCAVFNAVLFLLLAEQARHIPFACLAAILFLVGMTLIDVRDIRRIVRTSRTDASVCLMTFMATLLLPLTYAIYVGIFINLALYLRHTSQLRMAEMVGTGAGPFIERPLQEKTGRRKVIFLQFEGDLFFGVADELRQRLTRLASCPVRVVIFRLKRTHLIDATALGVFEQFVRQMHTQDRHVILCGIKPELMEVVRRYGLIDLIGPENAFETGYGIFTSAKRALARAKAIVGGSIDAMDMNLDETEGWAYAI